MIIGQTIQGAGTYYTPWFPRQGDGAVFGAEAIALASSGTLTVILQTKNRADTDSGASNPTGGTMTLTATGIGTVSVTGLDELVRFQCTVNDGKWIHFRMLPPAWRMNGA